MHYIVETIIQKFSRVRDLVVFVAVSCTSHFKRNTMNLVILNEMC